MGKSGRKGWFIGCGHMNGAIKLAMAANRGRIDEQECEGLELIGGSDRKYIRKYKTWLIIGRSTTDDWINAELYLYCRSFLVCSL